MKARRHRAIAKRPCQLSTTLETPELTRMNAVERQAMILRLAQLILQAGGTKITRTAMTHVDLPTSLLKRKAVVYVRQSTPAQVQLNREGERAASGTD